ncbi:MAG: galactokinase, partial [bacterium]|nr:galactokinase [bacterium]
MADEKIVKKERIKSVRKEFLSIFGQQKGLRFFRAPGRVNLIGEHTDYNGGFVLPAGIDRSIIVCAGLNDKNLLRLYSLNFGTKVECPLSKIEYRSEDGWANYPKGVAKMLQEQGYTLKGIDMVFESDIPIGRGLASSAAIEVVSCFALIKLSDIEIEKDRIPGICQSAENKFIGMKCGIMDQFVITMCQKDSVLFLDCLNLQYEHILINNPDFVFIITDSKVKRELVNSVYNTRLKECREGVQILKNFIKDIQYLRDVSAEKFSYYRDELPDL